MSPDPQDITRIQKLLALKRHEQPPPRFFTDFSDRVISHLHTRRPIGPVSWWQRLGLDLDVKLPLIYAFGVVVCGLLAFVVISGRQGEEAGPVAGTATGNEHGLAMTSPRPPQLAGRLSVPQGIAGSTAPMISTPSASTPFNQFSLHVQPVNFAFGGN